MSIRRTAPGWALVPRAPGTTIVRWLYDALRTQILAGRLSPGSALPATRDLARQYGTSRGPVVAAYAQLAAEGYLEATVGSGTFVARTLPEELLHAAGAARVDAPQRTATRRRLARFALGATVYDTTHPGRLRAFRTNVPALRLFPTGLWAQVASRRLRRATLAMLHGCEPAGYAPLRSALAGYLARARGVACDPQRILIVSGVQEALDLALRVLVERGERVAVEDPGYPGARLLLAAAGARIVRAPVDRDGVRIEPRHLGGVRLFYVTPAHQFPLGVTLSLERRLTLLEWARQTGAMVFEDDYDSEFRYAGRPTPALQGMGGEHHVLLAGSFSKVLFPSLRLGYLVVPPDLVDRFSAVLSLGHRHAPVLTQAVLADFIDGGHFASHVRRMRGVYAERLEALTDAAGRELHGLLEVSPIEAGLQTAGWLAPGFDAGRVCDAAGERDLDLVPMSRYGPMPGGREGLHLGFAALEPREIRRGVSSVAALLAASRGRGRASRGSRALPGRRDLQ